MVGTATTDASGAYSLTFTPHRSGDVVASLTADPTVASAPQALAVKPKATVTHGTLVPFLTSTFVVKIAPAAYDGLVVVKVSHRGAVVGTYKARAKNGKATLHFPLRGVDGFTLSVVLPAAAGLDGRSLQAKVSVRAKTLSAGSSGPYVKGMLTALQRLRFRVPNVGSTFTSQVKDSVMAFQKAYRLSRSYVFNTACWRKIDGAKLIKARHASPSTHIEVDKGRQILMIVKGGKPCGHHLRLHRRHRQHAGGHLPHPAEAPLHELRLRRHAGAHHGLPAATSPCTAGWTCRRTRRATAACASPSGPATGPTTTRGSARRCTSTTDEEPRTAGRSAFGSARPSCVRASPPQAPSPRLTTAARAPR